MCKRLTCLIPLVLAFGLMGIVEAAYDTVGVYDVDDAPHHNQVDQSGTYSSHTGAAGPENVIDLATFQALIGPAFNANAGGVANLENANGSLDGQDIIAKFGVGKAKRIDDGQAVRRPLAAHGMSGLRAPRKDYFAVSVFSAPMQ